MSQQFEQAMQKVTMTIAEGVDRNTALIQRQEARLLVQLAALGRDLAQVRNATAPAEHDRPTSRMVLSIVRSVMHELVTMLKCKSLSFRHCDDGQVFVIVDGDRPAVVGGTMLYHCVESVLSDYYDLQPMPVFKTNLCDMCRPADDSPAE